MKLAKQIKITLGHGTSKPRDSINDTAAKHSDAELMAEGSVWRCDGKADNCPSRTHSQRGTGPGVIGGTGDSKAEQGQTETKAGA